MIHDLRTKIAKMEFEFERKKSKKKKWTIAEFSMKSNLFCGGRVSDELCNSNVQFRKVLLSEKKKRLQLQTPSEEKGTPISSHR